MDMFKKGAIAPRYFVAENKSILGFVASIFIKFINK